MRTRQRKKRPARGTSGSDAAERALGDGLRPRPVDERSTVLGADGRDTFTRECPVIAVDTSFSSKKVAAALDALAANRGYPKVITVDSGVRLEFIRPGKPVDNGYFESFSG